MPVYEYCCLQCSHRYEKRESFDASATQRCPACGGTARRVFHPPPIVFRGSGFYTTDNRRGSDGESERAARPAEAKDGESEKSDIAAT